MRQFLINSQDDDIAKYGLRSGVGLAAPKLMFQNE